MPFYCYTKLSQTLVLKGPSVSGEEAKSPSKSYNSIDIHTFYCFRYFEPRCLSDTLNRKCYIIWKWENFILSNKLFKELSSKNVSIGNAKLFIYSFQESFIISFDFRRTVAPFMKEHQKVPAFARNSQVSDWGFTMVVYEKIYFEGYLNIRNTFVSKIILHNNILYYVEYEGNYLNFRVP